MTTADTTRDLSKPEPPPRHNDNPSCHDLVVADMRERKQFGLKKYGTPLQPENGRNFLVDAYQEVLDLAVYLRGAIYEQENKRLTIEGVAVRTARGLVLTMPRPARHPALLAEIDAAMPGGDALLAEQGFITNAGEFVSREEAAAIAYANGQIKAPKRDLFSEDLW